jgi:hypothetical protein
MKQGLVKIYGAFLWLALGATTICNAMVVDIEPDDYSVGQDLSHISPYVTLQSVDPFTKNPVVASDSKWAPGTNHTLGHHSLSCINSPCNVNDYVGFGIFFNQAVSHVSLTALNWGYAPGLDAAWAAFDENGNRMAQGISGPGLLGESFAVDITLDGIWSLFVGGSESMNAVEFDHLSFETSALKVAEPPMSAITLLAVTGFLIAKRRKVAV